MDMNFWQECADLGCVVVPVRAYSRYNEAGNLSDEYFIGLRFAALRTHDNEAALDGDAFYMVDECITGRESFHGAPEEALAAFKAEEAQRKADTA